MLGRLLLESLRRARRRKAAAAGAIALALFGATSLVALLLAAGDHLSADLAGYGANLALAPASTGDTLPADGLAATRTIFWKNNLVAAAPLLPLRARFDGAISAPLVGTWFEHRFADGWTSGLPRVRPALSISGRWPREEALEVALGRRLAARLSRAVGESVEVELGANRNRFAVVGTVAGGEEEEEEALVPLAALSRLAGSPREAMTRAEFFAITVPEKVTGGRDPRAMSAEEYERWSCTAYPSSVAASIEGAIPGSRVAVVREVAGPSGDLVGRLRPVLLTVVLLVLAGGGLAAAATIAATLLERRGEIALLSALGAERSRIVGFFLVESSLVGAAAGALGGLAGLVGARLLGRVVFALDVPFEAPLLALAVPAGALLAILASLAPILSAVGRDPAARLGGEPA